MRKLNKKAKFSINFFGIAIALLIGCLAYFGYTIMNEESFTVNFNGSGLFYDEDYDRVLTKGSSVVKKNGMVIIFLLPMVIRNIIWDQIRFPMWIQDLEYSGVDTVSLKTVMR